MVSGPAKQNCIIAINTDTFKPNWTTHIKYNKYQMGKATFSPFAAHRERLMALEA